MAIGGQIDTNTSFISSTRVIQRVVSHRAVQVPPLYGKVYQEIGNDPKRNFMDIGAYAELGTFQQKDEGNAPAYDQPYELIPAHFEFFTFSLAARVTREAQDEDPLDLMGKLAPMLADSERVTKDLLYWNTINLGYNPVVTMSDGQPLFSSNHLLSPVPGDSGPVSKINRTFSNNLGALQLTPDAVRLGELIFENMLSDRANPAQRTALWLMCHPDLAKTAQEVTGSPYVPGSDENTINTEYQVVKIFANRYLTNTAAWYLMGPQGGIDGGDGHSLLTSHKRQNDVLTWWDPETRSWNVSSEFRSTWGAGDWRSLVASLGFG